MPIRVEHGPNLAPVGQLAYQTGQLEYRNKRRTELERIAMQQAEMRQRAQQQQNQIAASLQGQKMSHMNAMQRLAMGQQFGQINAEQANQWKVQADVKAQENKMVWGKQLGQNQLDLANMNAGIADQRGIQRLQNNHRQQEAFQHLNTAGEAEYLNYSQQITAAQNDPKIPPQELEGHIAQLQAQQAALQDQDEFTYGNDTKPGFQSVHISHPPKTDEDDLSQPLAGKPKVYKTVKVRNPDGSVVYEYTPATTQMVDMGHDGEPHMVEMPLSPQEIHDNTTTVVKRNGRDYLAHLNSTNGIFEVPDNAQPIETPEWKEAEAERERVKAEAAAQEARNEAAIQWEIDERDKWRDYNNRQNDPERQIDLDQWLEEAGANPYRDPPAPAPEDLSGLDTRIPLEPNVDPQAPAPAQGGMPGMGGAGFEGGFPADMPPEQQGQMQQHAAAVDQHMQQPVAPPDLNAPAGAPGTEPVVLNAEEAMQMVQGGQIPEGTIVQLPSGEKIPAGQQADPNNAPLMIQANPKPQQGQQQQPLQQQAQQPPQQVQEYQDVLTEMRAMGSSSGEFGGRVNRKNLAEMVPRLNKVLKELDPENYHPHTAKGLTVLDAEDFRRVVASLEIAMEDNGHTPVQGTLSQRLRREDERFNRKNIAEFIPELNALLGEGTINASSLVQYDWDDFDRFVKSVELAEKNQGPPKNEVGR